MEWGSWLCCEKMAVLHGGFLLAMKKSERSMLSEMKKADWATLGKPIVCAVQEICASEAEVDQGPREANMWQKKVLAFVWAKLLNCNANKANINEKIDIDAENDRRWKEDLFFSVESMIPEINHTILFELVKSLGASELFVELLLALPADTCHQEMTCFVEHVLDDTSEEDVAIFLDVWWELLKQHHGQRDELVQTFGEEVKKYLACSVDEFSSSSKRLKLDPDVALFSFAGHWSIPSLFVDCLKKMKNQVVPYVYKCSAIAKMSYTLCKSLVSGSSVELSAEMYLQKLSKLIVLGNPMIQPFPITKYFICIVKKSERELQALYQKSGFQLPQGELAPGIELLADIFQSWGAEIQTELKHDTNGQRRNLALYRTVESLKCLNQVGPLIQDCEMVPHKAKEILSDLILSSSSFVQKFDYYILSGSATIMDKVKMSVALTIIDSRMERYEEMCEIVASTPSWAFSESGWLNCLEKNRDIFQSTDLVLKLARTLKDGSTCTATELSKVKRLKSVVLDCLSALSISDKNNALLGVLSAYGGKGLCADGGPLKDWFEEEVNLVFNCITQSDTGNCIEKEVTDVIRVAFLNPEATIQKMCCLAALNLGAHKLFSQILKNIPALSYKDGQTAEGINILAKCLLETTFDSLSSIKEENQFLEFLTSLMEPGERIDEEPSLPLLQPAHIVKIFVLPYLTGGHSNVMFPLKILNSALKMSTTDDGTKEHWLLNCCPFPLTFALSQLLDSCILCWEVDSAKTSHHVSIEAKGLLIETLDMACDAVEQMISLNPEMWSTSVCWLYRKTEPLDWTVRLRLKTVFGAHFKYEVPTTLFEVCDLSNDGWSSISLPQYGPGTGLLAWMECCSVSTHMMEQMLSHLVIDAKNVEEVNMFSKGFLIALIQLLPWCSSSEWKRLNHVVKSLLQRELLHVPFSLEYVHYLPLLNLRPFTHHLQFSQLLLRAFQLICSHGCSDWIPTSGWKYVARQCAGSMSDILESVKCRLKGLTVQSLDGNQEAIFVIVQLFCHVIHIMVMMPTGTSDSLYYVSLELLSQYEALTLGNTSTTGLLNKVNEKHFLHSIAENLVSEEQRSVLLQKISTIC
ncbi:vacuolar protein sorting-associated protein 53 homolog isoform X1 [Narcine bancroftii]|uniref:vacuolar protein sorting-associated protein 53 homolog isoform X1 n=1 Tax=Narcine bancroftii TaxID=1343680 RepID=UPI0038319CB5